MFCRFFYFIRIMKDLSILAAAAALLLVSCAPKTPDPVEQAICTEISAMPQGFTKVSVTSYERVDSTTFAQEFERRVKLFEAKRDADSKFLLKYLQEGKNRNAAIKNESYVRDLMILKGLDSLRAVCADIMDQVAYYDYVFDADASGEEGKMYFRQANAAITPDYQVIGMTSQQKDLHKGLGKVIPGYLELVKGAEDEEESSE